MALTSDGVLPSLYEYYTGGVINSGLNADKPYFTLNDKNITIYSGAMHYFRVPRAYWRDRLRKIRAAGLNTVETYVPWNLHEPESGRFDFGEGGSDMEDFLHLEEFIKTAQSEDLFVITRPGPFICSEWEFGGFPSWLLREKAIQFRTSETTFMKYVTRYFNVLLPILAALQFTRGGPIIAFQVENEYGSTEEPGNFIPDKLYLKQLRQLFLNNSIVELLVSSDSPTMYGDVGTLPGLLLQTANFAGNPEYEFRRLQQLQPNKPVMAMEFWTGWFDHWSEVHHKRSNDDFYDVYERILKYPASVNMYMFHGGTNFGFMNGANLANVLTDNSGFQPDTSSYDYDAPLSESGDYTIKYVVVKNLLKRYNPIATRIPCTPAITKKIAYKTAHIESQLSWNDLLGEINYRHFSEDLIPMELLPINNMSGQSYGYTLYRKEFIDIPANSVLTIGGRVSDTVIVLVDGMLMSKPLSDNNDLNGFGFWRQKNSQLRLGSSDMFGVTLDILVENWGRVNFGHIEQFRQFRGLWQGSVYLNNEVLRNWETVPIEFKKQWTSTLKSWQILKSPSTQGPSLYKTSFYVQEAHDTFLDMLDWCKGIVIINNFVLGRYSKIGPQQSLYLPGPFLKPGWNSIIIFEHYSPATEVRFSKHPIYLTRNIKKKSY